jgi:hypothetical protein
MYEAVGLTSYSPPRESHFLWDIVRCCQYLDYKASNTRMTDELETIWKESVVAYLRYHHGIFLEGLRKTTKTSVMIPGEPALILSRNRYHCTNSYGARTSHLISEEIFVSGSHMLDLCSAQFSMY